MIAILVAIAMFVIVYGLIVLISEIRRAEKKGEDYD